MSARLLLEVALRVLGLWFALRSIITLAATAPYYLSSVWNSSIPNVAGYLVASGGTFVVQFALGAALIRWAPGISARFYPPDAENEEPRIGFGPGDLYRIACFVLGVYLIAQAVQPASRLTVAGFQRAFGSWNPTQVAIDTMATIIYSVLGMLLIFGSQRIGEWFSNLRYDSNRNDPNTIPKPQFTIAAILILIVIFAVCFAVIRGIMVCGL